jgi:hypothetical protein
LDQLELIHILEHQSLQLLVAVVVVDPMLLDKLVVLVVEDQIGQLLEHLEEQAILQQQHLHKAVLVDLVQVQMLAAVVAVALLVLVRMDLRQVVVLVELVFNYQQHLEIQHPNHHLLVVD